MGFEMTRGQVVFAVVLAMVVLYPLTMRWLAETVQPQRLRMAALISDMLADARLSERARQSLVAMADNAFRPMVAIMVAGAIFPFALGRLAGWIKDEDCNTDHIYPVDLREKINEIKRLHVASIAAANPFFFLLATIEIAICAPIFAAVAVLGFLRDGAVEADGLTHDPHTNKAKVAVRQKRRQVAANTFDPRALLTMATFSADRTLAGRSA